MDINRIKNEIDLINKYDKEVNIMEVCGTHTMAISKMGLRNILNNNINLISGPGCPVCVTPDIYIDYIYELSLREEIIIATYGDMLRVPGSSPHISLEKAKAKGAKINMVYSSIDALNLAEKNKDKKVVFLGIGFETTMPAAAVAVKEADERGIDNFYILSMHKLVEPVMRTILEDNTIKIDGFLCPGHVSAVLGVKGFQFLSEYDCPGVIAGFEADEVVQGIREVLSMIEQDDIGIKNEYEKLVRHEGNEAAWDIIEEVFTPVDDYWRGLGKIKKSGMKLREKYSNYDIEKIYPISNNHGVKRKNRCMCGEVLKGKIKPNQCSLFGKACNPLNPIGPCMVSSEGSCAAYYKYNFK